MSNSDTIEVIYNQIVLYKGDDSGGSFGRVTRFILVAQEGVSLSGCTATFSFAGVTKTWTNLAPTVAVVVNFTKAETDSMPTGAGYGTFRITDSYGKVRTFFDNIPVTVTTDISQVYPGGSELTLFLRGGLFNGWYSGTVVNAAGTFSIPGAVEGDLYLNTSQSKVYKCTAYNDTGTTTWAVSINSLVGATGPANTLTVGTVTGGESAAVTITGESPNQTINFVLPKGDSGAAAGFGSITASATPVAAGGNPTATVTATGTSSAKNLAFAFGIPRGADGTNGTNGINGTDGADGDDAEVTISTSAIDPSAEHPTGGVQTTLTPYSGGTAGTPAVFSVYNGINGTNGTNGTNGINGTDGKDASVEISSESVSGGTRVTLTPISGGTAGQSTSFVVNNGTNGADGAAATITAGTTTTGAAGTDASVTNVGTSSAAVFDFTIPRGNTGATGVGIGSVEKKSTAGSVDTYSVKSNETTPAELGTFTVTNGTNGSAASVTVGTTTTGAPGTSASVTNSGTSSAAVLNFTIPKGADGTNGTNGTNGKDASITATTASIPVSQEHPAGGVKTTLTPYSGGTAGTPVEISIYNGTNGTNGTDGADGEDGADGVSPTVTAGTTTTGNPGTQASVVNSGTTSAAVFDFTIPRGSPGVSASASVSKTGKTATITCQTGSETATTATVNDGEDAGLTVSATSVQGGTQVTLTPYSGETPGTPTSFTVTNGVNGTNGTNGSAATITVGTTTTGAAGTNASVTEASGSTAQNRILNFTIPRGNTGTSASAQVVKSGKTATITCATGAVSTSAAVEDGKDASVTISTTPISSTTAHPTGGVKTTLTPYSGTTAGTPTEISIYNGANGANGVDGTAVVHDYSTGSAVAVSDFKYAVVSELPRTTVQDVFYFVTE